MAQEQQAPPESDSSVKVTVSEAIGTIFLGAIALFLLLALLQTQKRNRALMEKLAQQET